MTEEHKCTAFYYCNLDNGDRFLVCNECQRMVLMCTISIEDKIYNLKEYSDDVLRDSI